MRLLKENAAEIAAACSYCDLARIALRSLRRLPDRERGSVVMVCGPIKHGGALLKKCHDQETARRMNRAELKGVISFLARERAVFNQLPFLDRAEEIGTGKAVRRLRSGSLRDYVLSLFSRGREKRERISDRDRLRKEFHLPILRSGLIHTIYFLNGWRDSEGSRWYHDRAKELGIECRYVIPVKRKPAPSLP